MPYIETSMDLAEDLADLIGVYGAHSNYCKPEKPCRVCFVPELAERIRAAAANDAKMERIAAVDPS